LDWPVTLLKASLVGKRERLVLYRIISYLISAVHFRWKEREVPPVDAVISSSDFFCDTAPARLLKKRRPSIRWIAMIYHLYTEPWKRPGNPLVNWTWYLLQRLSLRGIAWHADAAMVFDTEAGDRVEACLKSYGMNSARIHRICSGLSLLRLQRPENAPTGEYIGLFVGELRPNKGIFDLVEIWKEVCVKLPDAKLCVVGGGDPRIRRRLEAEIEGAGMGGRIVLAGTLSNEDLVKAYHSARTLVAPSHEEGWGMAIVEAMAAGLPVVAYNLPVYQRHFEGAFLAIPPFDKRRFAEGILDVLANTGREDAMREAGLKCSRLFDWPLIAEHDWALLQRVIVDPKEGDNRYPG
jgi:glycosyltransferase involved in cell wall biosynthesis